MAGIGIDSLDLAKEVAAAVARVLSDSPGRPGLVGEEKEVLNTQETADLLRVSRKTIDDYADRGQIPHQRLGRIKLFSRSAIMAWLSQCKTTSHRKGR